MQQTLMKICCCSASPRLKACSRDLEWAAFRPFYLISCSRRCKTCQQRNSGGIGHLRRSASWWSLRCAPVEMSRQVCFEWLVSWSKRWLCPEMQLPVCDHLHCMRYALHCFYVVVWSARRCSRLEWSLVGALKRSPDWLQIKAHFAATQPSVFELQSILEK